MSKRWAFTLFINEVSDAESYLKSISVESYTQFLIGQVERAPSTDRLHIQGYIEFKTRCSMSQAKIQLHEPSIHLERARGSAEENIDYCSKPQAVAGPWKFGTLSVQGKRSDLIDIAQKILGGAPLATIAQEHPGDFVRYHKGFAALQACTNIQPRQWVTDVVVLIGPTGCGKTKYAYDADPNLYRASDPRGKWWDGYTGQDTVLIDDFSGEIDYTYLLQLLDRYPLSVQTKGGWTNFKPHKIFITSNLQMNSWYNRFDIDPLKRRVTTTLQWDDNQKKFV